MIFIFFSIKRSKETTYTFLKYTNTHTFTILLPTILDAKMSALKLSGEHKSDSEFGIYFHYIHFVCIFFLFFFYLAKHIYNKEYFVWEIIEIE